MVLTYRRPGVYLSESLLVNPGGTSSANTVACFVGACEKGPLNEPVLVESWSDYVAQFGGFNTIPNPQVAGVKALPFMPYSLYGFYQNGGRQAWIIRSAPSDAVGSQASIIVNGLKPGPAELISFKLSAISTGVWGNNLSYYVVKQEDKDLDPTAGTDNHRVFTLKILLKNSEGVDEVVETFTGLTITGDIIGSRRLDAAVNDVYSGSQYVRVSNVNEVQTQPVESNAYMTGGVDPNLPTADKLKASALLAEKIEGPVTLNIVGHLTDAAAMGTAGAIFISESIDPTASFPDRSDVFVVNDSAPPRPPGVTSSVYASSHLDNLKKHAGNSYVAAYGPWIKVPHPQRVGQVLDIPPGGSVMGVMSRIDATIGMFRAPAGVIAGLTNAVGVQTKFTDTELGDLNALNVHMIRSVVGAGIAVMGARTRKSYGADRYVSARRTLIYISEVLRRSTQFAVFENNDQRLWTSLTMSADRILRPLWEAGGLRGANASEAFFIRCDSSNNTMANIQAGEVRMEVGVALEYPAEFVIIRLTQFDRGTFTAEVQPGT